MISQIKKIIVNENGVTLVEVIASFALLVIILFSFFTLFIQTAKTTKSSEKIVDATYVAQTEMERLYAVIINKKFTDQEVVLTNELNYISTKCEKYTFYKNVSEYPNYIIILKKDTIGDNLSKVIISVYNKNDISNSTDTCKINAQTNYKAQMENYLQWKGK